MALDGINIKCEKCKDSCKQFKQVKVVHCPVFDPIDTDGET